MKEENYTRNTNEKKMNVEDNLSSSSSSSKTKRESIDYFQDSVVKRLGYAEGVSFHKPILNEVKEKFYKMYLEIVEIIAETGRDTKYRNMMTLEKAQNILNIRIINNIVKPPVNPGGWANKKRKEAEAAGNKSSCNGGGSNGSSSNNGGGDGNKSSDNNSNCNEEEEESLINTFEDKQGIKKKMKLLKGKVLDTSSLVLKRKKSNQTNIIFSTTDGDGDDGDKPEKEEEKVVIGIEKENLNSNPIKTINQKKYYKSKKIIEKEKYMNKLLHSKPNKYYPFLKERSLEFNDKLQNIILHDIRIPPFTKEEQDKIKNSLPDDLPKNLKSSIPYRSLIYYSNPEFETYYIIPPTTFFRNIRKDARKFGKIQFTRDSIFLIHKVVEIYIRDYLKVLRIINDERVKQDNRKSTYITKTTIAIYDALKKAKRIV